MKSGNNASFGRRLRLVTMATVPVAALTIGLAAAFGAPVITPFAQSAVGLGTAEPFAVLAGSTVTNTGPSILTGDLGVSPGTAITGFPPGLDIGATHPPTPSPLQAQNDLTTAYNDAAGRGPVTTCRRDLGGQTLAPGVYNSAGALGLTGTVTLDAQNDPNAVFIFQAGSTLITASNSTVALINGAQAVQRLLAGRQLGDARHEHHVRRHRDGADVDLRADRHHGRRPVARPQRRCDPR